MFGQPRPRRLWRCAAESKDAGSIPAAMAAFQMEAKKNPSHAPARGTRVNAEHRRRWWRSSGVGGVVVVWVVCSGVGGVMRRMGGSAEKFFNFF